jgi:hypothetical protein
MENLEREGGGEESTYGEDEVKGLKKGKRKGKER